MGGEAALDTVLARMREVCAEEAFLDELIGFLDDLCVVDTSPYPDPGLMRKREGLTFELINDFLSDCASVNVAGDERAIVPSIADHPSFTKTQYLCAPDRPEGFPPEEAYSGRGNLVVAIDGPVGKGGRDVAVNAHVDVSAFFAPRRRGDRYHGSGAADGKANVAALCGAIKLIDRLVEDGLVRLHNRISAMFVVDAESGGNGSLALAKDRVLKRRYKSLLVLAGTGGRVCSAARGESWFRCEATWSGKAAGDFSTAVLCAVGAAVQELQREGAAIREESEHSLFPGRPVSTTFGMLGPYGASPASACGEITLEIGGVAADAVEGLRIVVLAAVERHAARFGAQAPAAHEFGFEMQSDGSTVLVTLQGSLALEGDDAILKLAGVIGEIESWRQRGGFPWILRLRGHDVVCGLVLEGAQSFLPTHELASVEQRLTQAFERGVVASLAGAGFPPESVSCATSFERRHGEAFSGDPDSPTALTARGAAADAGLAEAEEPVLGWVGPSDARLFARQYPALPVVIAGVGARERAHSDGENIALADMAKGVIFCALFLLRETGALPAASKV